MEVLLAVVIMGSALAILLGLQSSLIDQSLRDRYQQDAMLLARRVLAAIETGELEPQVVEERLSAVDMLGEFLELGENGQSEPESLGDFEIFLSIQPFGLPQMEDAMKQIVVRVYHRSMEQEILEVVYYIPFGGDANK